MKKVFLVLLTICSIAVSCTKHSPPVSQHVHTANLGKKVLFISSYSYDWWTVPEEISGYKSAINPEAETHYLFMDSRKKKFFKGSEDWEDFKTLVAKLWKNHGPYDAVVLGDDTALIFALDTYGELFAPAPVVFLGIDSISLANKAFLTGHMTGQIETHYDLENLKLIKKLMPDIRNLYVLTDNTTSGIASREEFEKVRGFVSMETKYINASLLSHDAINNTLESLERPDALLVLNFGEDKDGHYYSEIISERITEHLHVPAFSSLGGINKLTAGYCISYFSIGKDAADITNKCLEGIASEDIRISFATPRYEFNWQQMRQYGIKIPEIIETEHTIIHNKPLSFLYRYYFPIISALSCLTISLLAGSLIYYVYNSRKKSKLIQSLREAKHAQTDFLSRMSHDMRTPMNAIIGLSNFGLTERSEDKVKSYFSQIISSSNYLMGLLNDLLDMSKLETGKISLYPEPVNTKKLFDDILTIVQPRAKMKNQSLNVNFEAHRFRSIFADRQRLQQVLINILNNAVKYTPDGGNISWIVEDSDVAAVRPAEDKKSRKSKPMPAVESGTELIIFTISDTGVGMSKEFQQKLFQPFSQENNVLSHAEGGSGLGLAIAKNIVSIMGGWIDCYSVKEKGSTFTIALPVTTVAEADASETKAALEKETSPEVMEGFFTGKRILVCDDNEINRIIATHVLEGWGAETEQAENGQEAVDKVKNTYYDAVLLDVRMPVMDGLEAARQIRTFNEDIPLIALSANAYKEDRNKSLEAGMNAHETKPIDQSTLFYTLKAVLDM